MSTPDTLARFSERADAWRRKPALRTIYADIYRRIADECVSGATLEVGGGTGMAKEFLPQVITSDIQATAGLDVVADCQALPFADCSLDNVVMVDVLHHLARPVLFLRESERVLRPGGRLVMVEPAMTPLSLPFYRWMHEERADLRVDPLDQLVPMTTEDPFDGNQAVPTLLFGRHAAATARAVPGLGLRHRRWFALWSYPLSGGFRPWSLLPAAGASPLLRFERLVEPLLGRGIGFRLLIAMERRDVGHE